jgi:hypothetical protein
MMINLSHMEYNIHPYKYDDDQTRALWNLTGQLDADSKWVLEFAKWKILSMSLPCMSISEK